MRTQDSTTAILAGKILLLGLALASLGSCVAPRAITEASRLELPVARSSGAIGSEPAPNFIGQARVGHGLDRDGKVPPSFGASKFAAGDPIHLSLWEVTDAAAGAVVHVSVRDAANRIVWNEAKEAPHGGSYLSFGIGRKLAPGKYRAEAIVAHEVTSLASFEVLH